MTFLEMRLQKIPLTLLSISTGDCTSCELQRNICSEILEVFHHIRDL
jgi:hypothetical protein